MAQDSSFEAMADRLNRIAVYRKADALAMLDSMYRMADLPPDSLLQTARCLNEEALLNLHQGIVDSSLTSRVESRLAASRQLSLPEQALLESTLGKCLMARGEYTEAFTVTLQASEKFGVSKSMFNYTYP